MRQIAIDIETYSSVPLAEAGVYKYAEAPDFRILLFAYSADGGGVQVLDFAQGARLPEGIVKALLDPTVEKWAYNAGFERVCLSRFLRDAGRLEGFLDPQGWRCSMVLGAAFGLPLGLAAAGAALGVEKRKLEEGKGLIKHFCVPAGSPRRLWGAAEDPNWELFKTYCARDVETESEIRERLLGDFEMPRGLWEDYEADQRVNDAGILVDQELAEAAVRLNAQASERLNARMRELTGLENPMSPPQLVSWLERKGIHTVSVDKKAVAEILRDTEDAAVKEVLGLRLAAAKSSVKKYEAMLNCRCADGRARGMFQFYGSRTGRWAGRLIQLQNLPQNHLQDLDAARALVRSGDSEMAEVLYENIPDTLSQLIRTAFTAREGTRFIVADYSAIEARVIAWLAGEKWRQEVFAEGGDIYCASASQMFKVPVEKHGVNGHLRQKGKIAELALGYGGGVGAMKNMGALEMGLSEAELHEIVAKWRAASPRIVKLWSEMQELALALETLSAPGRRMIRGRIIAAARNGTFFLMLPSGREIAYPGAQLRCGRFGGEVLSFMGTGLTRKWERLETYGPKLTENIVQGTARDILAGAIRALQGEGLRVVAHVHDEVIVEAPPSVTVAHVCEVMSRTPEWAEGLRLNAEGYETPYYRKD